MVLARWHVQIYFVCIICHLVWCRRVDAVASAAAAASDVVAFLLSHFLLFL